MSQQLFHTYQKQDNTSIKWLSHKKKYLIQEKEVLRHVLSDLGFNPERLALPIHQQGEDKIKWYSSFTGLKRFEELDATEQGEFSRRFEEFKGNVLDALLQSKSAYRGEFEKVFGNDFTSEQEEAYAPWIWANGNDFTIIWGAYRSKDEVTRHKVPPVKPTPTGDDDNPPGEPPVIRGCMDSNAINYNPDATEDDGSCIYAPPPPISGCMNPDALNYNPDATEDDGSCIYAPQPPISGCMDPKAKNFNSQATVDDGSCEYEPAIEPVGNWFNWFWFWLAVALLLLLAILFVGCPDCKTVYSPINGERIVNPAPELLPERPNELLPITEDDQFSEEIPNIILNRLNIYPKNEDTELGDFARDVVAFCPDTSVEVTHWDPLTKRIQISFDHIAYPNVKDTLKVALAEYDPLIWNESIFETSSISDPIFSDDQKGWHFKAINFSEKYLALGDPSVKIAVVDDGFDTTHEDFASISEDGYNICNANPNVYAVSRGVDQEGNPLGNFHGTHVSGISMAKYGNGKGGVGLSPNCTLLPIQISDEWSRGFASSYIIDAILYAINQEANVINLSLGYSMPKEVWEGFSDEDRSKFFEITRDEAEFWNELYLLGEGRGVVFVKAMGNSGLPMATDWMNRSAIPIYVLATGLDGGLTNFTNYPTEQDKFCCITAPGDMIFSTLPSNKYQALDGTSMSAPMVSSAVALMFAENNNLSPKSIRATFMNQAKKTYDSGLKLPYLDFQALLERTNIN